jgi:L-asparaginase/Glu-tRNA(Gln) amidotransferase subunit D
MFISTFNILYHRLRMVPGFDDQILRQMVRAGAESGSLKALVLQLYGTGNAPSVKEDLVNCIAEATELGILVVAATQCHRGSVMMGESFFGTLFQTECRRK